MPIYLLWPSSMRYLLQSTISVEEKWVGKVGLPLIRNIKSKGRSHGMQIQEHPSAKRPIGQTEISLWKNNFLLFHSPPRRQKNTIQVRKRGRSVQWHKIVPFNPRLGSLVDIKDGEPLETNVSFSLFSFLSLCVIEYSIVGPLKTWTKRACPSQRSTNHTGFIILFAGQLTLLVRDESYYPRSHVRVYLWSNDQRERENRAAS